MNDTANIDIKELLNQLRDIQEPVAPQGTSLWLISLCIALACLLITFLWFQRNRSHFAFRREAFIRIDAVANQNDSLHTRSMFDLATLLRQLMRHRVGNRVNALDNTAWLAALDAEFSSVWFTKGRGQVFGSALYCDTELTSEERKAICKELKSEIRRLKPITPVA